MIINIEQAQNGFVVRDNQESNPIVVADFNQLIGIVAQAFNIQADGEVAQQEPALEVDTKASSKSKTDKKS